MCQFQNISCISLKKVNYSHLPTFGIHARIRTMMSRLLLLLFLLTDAPRPHGGTNHTRNLSRSLSRRRRSYSHKARSPARLKKKDLQPKNGLACHFTPAPLARCVSLPAKATLGIRRPYCCCCNREGTPDCMGLSSMDIVQQRLLCIRE